jgi:membrane protein YdbS with pleckstrin-like domain
MENFTNETIDTTALPRFEFVPYTPLHAAYWKVLLINMGVLMAITAIGVGVLFVNVPELAGYEVKIIGGLLVLFGLILFFVRLGFSKKGFAFRNHDVLFRQGVIATNIMVIPYNRIQHVALHEGIISRIFGLAKIEIFTAGGNSSDLEIPGIKKEHAENIKQLLMGKIQKEL